MERFIIKKNYFLTQQDTKGYYHQLYTGFKQPENPNFINVLKNTYNINNLINARNNVIDILMKDISCIIKEEQLEECVCICVPRAKALYSYSKTQLYFKEAVNIVANKLYGVIDGTNYITRIKNTYTTHLAKASREGKIENDGEKPYKGITIDTCRIEKSRIAGKNIILIDDIYTNTVNIDEDCIQALFDNGAKNIIYYSIGYTRRI